MVQPILVIDGHGGDYGPAITIPATNIVATQYPDFLFDIILSEAVIKEVKSSSSRLAPANVRFLVNSDLIDPNTSPSYILRHKRHSTLGQALSRVAEGKAVGCLSSANTGALVALSRHFLSRFSNIKKPALIKPIPGGSYLLDLGANIDCAADDLVRFAYLGIAFCHATQEHAAPGVALLNVGSENHKGTKVIRAVHNQLKQQNIHYNGFIEANDLFNNRSQVIVCDGLVGNIALKTSEGLSQHLQAEIYRQLAQLGNEQSSIETLFKTIKHQMNPAQYNGACLLGLDGLVVKSHGSANQQGFSSALTYLVEQVAHGTLFKLQRYWASSPFSLS